jgi:DNA-binding CsgD family transcriptional regulator
MATPKSGTHVSFISHDRSWGGIEREPEPLPPVPVRQDNPQLRLDPAARGNLTACDLLGAGLVVCDPQARIVAANRSAISILRTGNALSVNSGGVLCAVGQHKPNQPTLQELVARTLEGHKPSAIVIPRSAHEPGLTVIVRERVPQEETTLPYHPAVFVLILDPSLPAKPGTAKLRELYRLTPGELHLAELLMDGRSLNECCDQLAISRSKGRQHLQGLFRKTGVRRQSHLIALLLEYALAQRGACEGVSGGLFADGHPHRRRAANLGSFMRHRR